MLPTGQTTTYGYRFTFYLSGHQKAKSQNLVGIDNQDNALTGDVVFIFDKAKGENLTTS